MAVLGGAIGNIRGPDGPLREDRGPECQLGLLNLRSDSSDLVRARQHRYRYGTVATAWLRRRAKLPVPWTRRARTGASWLCYFRALQLGDAALVAPIDILSVVFVALA